MGRGEEPVHPGHWGRPPPVLAPDPGAGRPVIPRLALASPSQLHSPRQPIAKALATPPAQPAGMLRASSFTRLATPGGRPMRPTVLALGIAAVVGALMQSGAPAQPPPSQPIIGNAPPA